MLVKRSEARATRQRLATAYAGLSSGGLDRRSLLRQAGIGAGGLAALGALPAARTRRAEAATVMRSDAPIERIAVDDVPMPYHPALLDAVLPDADRVAARIDALLRT